MKDVGGRIPPLPIAHCHEIATRDRKCCQGTNERSAIIMVLNRFEWRIRFSPCKKMLQQAMQNSVFGQVFKESVGTVTSSSF
jgi:hypothetical protein